MLTGKYRKGETVRAKGFGGKVFQAKDTAQRTITLDRVKSVFKGKIIKSVLYIPFDFSYYFLYIFSYI